MTQGYRPIRDYAIIGDGETAALIASNGSVDWCCWPRFDSGAVFCRLLDCSIGGWFQICPAGEFEVKRRYVPNTNILETEFSSAEGRFRLTDFMPVDGGGAGGKLLRCVEGLGGSSAVEVSVRPTFEFARERTRITAAERGIVARGGEHMLSVACPDRFSVESDGAARAVLRVKQGERIWLAAAFRHELDGAAKAAAEAEDDLQRTTEFWQRWSAASSYRGPYREQVRRSALALKALIYAPTGALVAAPTTSLPERIRGTRNWDYRYTWLRDSTLTVDALVALGYHSEALNFFGWLERLKLHDREDLQIMYTVSGGSRLPERELEHLDGYRSSRPVRVGNAASKHVQLDIYGEVLGAAHVCFDKTGHQVSPETWRTLSMLANQAATRWREDDRSIWETRGEPKPFLYSKLRCWVAVDRAIRIAEDLKLRGNLDAWRGARGEIREAILNQGFNKEVGAFTQAFGSQELDASALTIPHVGFLPFDDPRVRSTTNRIRQRLTDQGLLRRTLANAETPAEEGAFTLCSFWLVDTLAMLGQIDEAHRLFEAVTRHASDLGLLSEEIDPSTGELLGNYPQGLAHLGLIRSADILGRAGEGKQKTYQVGATYDLD